MQFSISTIALVASLLASQASGMPLELTRRDICGVTPSGPSPQSPIGTPSESTAEGCKQACIALPGCLSFAFGLPPNAPAPICELFPVPASQVPPQSQNIEVFDVACGNVPTTPPTASNPVGLE